jgi:hypothetical protein
VDVVAAAAAAAAAREVALREEGGLERRAVFLEEPEALKAFFLRPPVKAFVLAHYKQKLLLEASGCVGGVSMYYMYIDVCICMSIYTWGGFGGGRGGGMVDVYLGNLVG